MKLAIYKSTEGGSECSEFTSTANTGFNGGYLNKEAVLVYLRHTAVQRKCKAVPAQISVTPWSMGAVAV